MEEEYTGYREVCTSDNELAMMYEHPGENRYGLLPNQYLIARSCPIDEKAGSVIDTFKWTGEKHVRVPFKQVNNRFIGKVKPRNVHQQLAIDMLYDANSTVNIVYGKYGSGKNSIMSAVAMDLIERGKFEKIVFVRNNIEVKDSKPIGYLPGSYHEKLLPFAMCLSDHTGGIDGLELLINQGKIEPIHLGFIRGRDIKNSIIHCSEAENMTREHIQLLISRVGEGSVLWLDGDFRQRDAAIFEKNSGLAAAINKLKGHPRFACVKLMKTERSETAAMADLLDD